MNYIKFDIEPVGKPRMTQSDKWNERPPVLKYRAFEEELNYKANLKGYEIGKILNIVFYLSVKSNWSEKKKKDMIDQPHEEKPDLDNLIKAFTDSLKKNDSNIWKINAEKKWATKGYIEVMI